MNNNNRNIIGVGITNGRIIGKIIQMGPPISPPEEYNKTTNNHKAEIEKLENAINETKKQLEILAKSSNGSAKEILEATALMTADPTLISEAKKHIETQNLNAEHSIWQATQIIAETLKNLGGYMAHRVQDIEDVRNRIVAHLRGAKAPGIPQSETPFILAAHDLAPADTATLDSEKILALITSDGGPQSHTAILARQLGIPAIVAAPGVTEIPNETEIYLDAATGTIVINPSDAERELSEIWKKRLTNKETFSGQCFLSDGTEIQLLVNVGSSSDAKTAKKEYNAKGVGLLRTEFLFLNSTTEPTMETQIEHYNEIFQQFPGEKVVIRTLDAGADKPLPFLTEENEPNPALGVRGYRTNNNSQTILRNQLQAIAIAEKNNTADVWVMAPMISTSKETQEFANICKETGIKTVGVMVEVPAAALCAKQICEVADFVSIGTNDLTQYTMAADRQLGSLAELNNSWQPAVLELIKITVIGASNNSNKKKPVGVCGEAAADPALAVVLIGLGVDSLSMTARALYDVSKVLETVTLQHAKELAEIAINAHSATEAKELVRKHLPILEELGI